MVTLQGAYIKELRTGENPSLINRLEERTRKNLETLLSKVEHISGLMARGKALQ